MAKVVHHSLKGHSPMGLSLSVPSGHPFFDSWPTVQGGLTLIRVMRSLFPSLSYTYTVLNYVLYGDLFCSIQKEISLLFIIKYSRHNVFITKP